MLQAIHGAEPRILAEDFCGTGAVARAWIEVIPRSSAVATDRDTEVLARIPRHSRLRRLRADVLFRTPPARADVLFVGNFSIGEIHERARLVEYLRRSRRRLRPRGVFVCDIYGGGTALQTGRWRRTLPGPAGTRVRYTWEQRAADPVTCMVENAMHFRVVRGHTTVLDLPDAFVYRWRLWSIPELREAMAEAGFRRTGVHDAVPDAIDESGRAYLRPPMATDDGSVIALVCAWIS